MLGQEFDFGSANSIVLIFAGECVFIDCSECFLNPVISQDQKVNSETQTFFDFLTKSFPFIPEKEKPSAHKFFKKTSIFQ